MAAGPAQIYEFGRFRLDAVRGVLLRDGERVPLIPKAIDLLVALLMEAGTVVPKAQLMERVWPDAFVQESSLFKLVFLLRRELEKAPGSGRIETVSKRGYVFTGEVRALEDAAAGIPSNSVAVLPFVALGPETPAHLGESVADELITALSRTGAMSVVARTSSFQLAAVPHVSLEELGRHLRVASIVEGTVRAEARTIRVNAALVDVASGFQRWSQPFETLSRGVSLIPDLIAAEIAGELNPHQEPPSLPARAVDPAAYDLYLQGRYFWNRRPGGATWKALDLFEQAVQRDPQFAQAWSGIADVYSTLGSWEAGVLPHADAQQKAREHARRALALDPRLAEALTTLAYTVLHYDWDPTAAEEGFARALHENPSYAAAHHWRSHALVAQGRMDESLTVSRVALSHDPMNLLLGAHLAWHYHMARQPERALEQAERVIRQDPHFHWGHYFLAWGAEGSGDIPKALDAARTAVTISGDDPVMRALLGRVLAVAGERTQAMAAAEAILAEDPRLERYAYELALIHLGLGDAARAFELLVRARDHRSGWIVYADVDPRLDPLRDADAWRGLLPLRRR